MRRDSNETASDKAGAVQTGPDEDAIGKIKKYVVPVLCYGYLNSKVVALIEDIRRCCTDWVDSAQAEGWELEDWVDLLSTDSRKDDRYELYAACDQVPLLRYRIFRTMEYLTNVSISRKEVLAHQERLEFHLERMYRVRNVLVHSGQGGGRIIPSLVMNLHSYVDDTLIAIVGKLHSDRHSGQLEKTFYEYDLEYQSYLSRLRVIEKEGLSVPDIGRYLSFGS